MAKRVRDQQRSKVYAWERTLPGHANTEKMTLDEIRGVVKRIARHYKITPCNVGDGRGRRSACYTHWAREIKMPRWSRTLPIVLHEAAHWIHACVFNGRNEASHGREYVAVFMYLLSKYGNYRSDALARSANLARIDFASVDACRPKNT